MRFGNGLRPRARGTPLQCTQVGRKVIKGVVPSHAHETAGSASRIFYRLNLNRYRRIVNQTLMLPNTFLAAVSNSPVSRSLSLRQGSCRARNACAAIALAFLFWASPAFAQSSFEDAPRPIVPPKQPLLDEPLSSPQQEPHPTAPPPSSSVPPALPPSP